MGHDCLYMKQPAKQKCFQRATQSNETKRFSDLRMHMSACKQIAVLNETFECIASAAAAYQTIWMDSRDNSQQHDSL